MVLHSPRTGAGGRTTPPGSRRARGRLRVTGRGRGGGSRAGGAAAAAAGPGSAAGRAPAHRPGRAGSGHGRREAGRREGGAARPRAPQARREPTPDVMPPRRGEPGPGPPSIPPVLGSERALPRLTCSIPGKCSRPVGRGLELPGLMEPDGLEGSFHPKPFCHSMKLTGDEGVSVNRVGSQPCSTPGSVWRAGRSCSL